MVIMNQVFKFYFLSMKHIITFYNDISKYPPIISVITYLLSISTNVILVYFCSNKNYCIGGFSELTKESIAHNIMDIDSNYNKNTELTQCFVDNMNLEQHCSELL